MFKWGIRKIRALSLFICFTGAFTTFLGDSFLWLELGRTILGVGGGLILVVSFAIIPLWFSDQDLGKAMGIKALDMPLATVTALNFIPLLVSYYGWKASFAASTVILLFSTIIFYILYNEQNLKKGKVIVKLDKEIFQGILNRQIWLLGATFALINMAVFAYSTWAGTFFIQLKNVPLNLAFFMASIIAVAMIPLNPAVGILCDRLGRRKVFIMASAMLMGVSFMLMPFFYLPMLLIPVALLAVAAFFPTPIFTLPSEILSKERARLGFGILFSCGSLGIVIGPIIVGYVKDIFPGGAPSFFTMTALSILAFIFSTLLKVK
jgi:predicted MFS family arabinose efflux permease